MESFEKIVNSIKPLTIVAKLSVLDVCEGLTTFLEMDQTNNKIKTAEENVSVTLSVDFKVPFFTLRLLFPNTKYFMIL